MPLTPLAPSPGNDSELHELLTVEDVAALLKVSPGAIPSDISDSGATVGVLPMKYKHSTQKNHQHIMKKHLIPQFGELALCEVTTPAIQTYVTHLIKVG